VNTIAITNTETNEVITYTEAEVQRFIKDCADAKERSHESTKNTITIRSKVYEFFNSQYSPGDQEITTSVEEINDMLRDIGADELRRTWSASVRIYVNVSGIEAASKEEVEDIIRDDINVELQSVDGEIWVDDVEVNDIAAE
jgi:phage/plasmid-associated DNA primase